MPDEPHPSAAVPAISLPFSVRALAVSIVTFAVAVAAIKAAAPIILPILLSILFAYTLEPAVALLMRTGLPRGVAAVIVFGLVLVGVRATGHAVLGQARAFVNDLPQTANMIRTELAARRSDSPGPLDEIRRAASELEHATAAIVPGTRSTARAVTIVKPPADVTSLLFGNTGTILWGAAYAGAVALLTFLLMATGDIFKRKLLRLGGREAERRKITLDVIKNIDRQIERYLLVRVLISGIVAALTALVLWPTGLRHWMTWGVVAGVLNVLPYAGPTAAVALIATAAFLQFKTVAAVGIAGGLAGLVALLEGNVLTPWLTSRAAELNTVAVFVGVLFWGWMWGVWGLLLAVPLLVAIKAAADHIEPLQPLGELLGR